SVTPIADSGAALPDDVKAVVSFSPVLWDGIVLDDDRIVPGLSDWPHRFELRTSEARGRVEEDLRRAARLTEVARAGHLASEDEAGFAILREAHGLDMEHNYLHHGWGVAPDGLLFVVAHGSLRALAELAQQAGASYLLITENGGSPQIGLRPPNGELRS